MIKHELKKITHYEYWPYWIFYLPMVPIWFWYSIKSGNLLYFTAVNPSMKFGGFFNYSKFKMQMMLDEKHRPKHHFIPQKNRDDIQIPFNFPFIAKPDIGERGDRVQLILNQSEWNYYLNNNLDNILLQEYIPGCIEFGIFFAKLPTEKKGKILSITGKKFLSYKGDGKKSLREFIESDARAYFNKSYLYMKFHDEQDLILPKDQVLVLEEIGNHSRGTYFCDATHLITPQLENAVNLILKDCKGFDYGRIDVKSTSVDDFNKGNFKILEFNGANSEAGHIYDNQYSLIRAYQEVIRHLKVQMQIAKFNMKNGVKPAKLSNFILELKDYLFRPKT